MPVSMVFPELDGVFANDMNPHPATNAVGFDVIRIAAWKALNGHETVSQQALILARPCFEELNDFVVNEQTIIHWPLPSSGNFNRWSKSSSVANSEAGLSILVESFLR